MFCRVVDFFLYVGYREGVLEMRGEIIEVGFFCGVVRGNLFLFC